MERQTCCVNVKPILDYLKASGFDDLSPFIKNLHPEIDSFNDPLSFLMDPHNWVPIEVIVKLLERTRLVLEDEQAPYRIAKFAVDNVSLGYIQKFFVKAFWSSEKGLRHVQKINDKFNRSKKVELVEADKTSAVVRLHWAPGMSHSKDICLYNKGIYTFLPTIWLGRPLKLTETACFFNGDPYCEYRMEWQIHNRVSEFLSGFFRPRAMLKDMLLEMERDKQLLEGKYEEVTRLNVELNRKIKQLEAIQDTGKAILSVLDLEQLLTFIMSILANVCKINRAVIMLVNRQGDHLEFVHGVGFDGDVPENIKRYRVSVGKVNNILARVASTGKSEYVPEVISSRLNRENVLLVEGRPTSVYVTPLITRSRVIGVIATDAVDGKGVPKETRETLELFTPQIAIAIENARLYLQLKDQMLELKRSHALLSRVERFTFLGDLAARLAHEIKNPLTAIGTFIQMLPRKFDDEEFRNQFYELAMEEIQRINNLITELLDLVKTKKPHFEFTSIHELIDKMILLVSPRSKEKGIEMVKNYNQNLDQIWLDPEKFKQIVLNILSNAIDFTPQGGRIEISTESSNCEGTLKGVRLAIRDNGPGIPESMQDKIFDPYFTTKHKSDLHSGTGLGLFIAHQNVLDHGGTIEVKSGPQAGTTFSIFLPNSPPT
ncbi:MAG: GAF domain-containing protein [Desulfobacteraceae bacterium]|nr:MAG: GAF domain-containing protein [Desulfobacteraceae bacterium]